MGVTHHGGKHNVGAKVFLGMMVGFVGMAEGRRVVGICVGSQGSHVSPVHVILTVRGTVE